MCTLLCIAIVIIFYLVYQNVKLNKEYDEMVNQYEERISRQNEGNNEMLSLYSQEVIELKEELKARDKSIEQKEFEIESLEMDFSEVDTYILSKFHPDGRIYNVNAANIAFYPEPSLTGRVYELFEFISDVSDPLEREDGITVYAYLTTKGVVYSDMRVSLYAYEK